MICVSFFSEKNILSDHDIRTCDSFIGGVVKIRRSAFWIPGIYYSYKSMLALFKKSGVYHGATSSMILRQHG